MSTVVLEAVQWRNNPEKIKARRADATYGTRVSIKFNEKSITHIIVITMKRKSVGGVKMYLMYLMCLLRKKT